MNSGSARHQGVTPFSSIMYTPHVTTTQDASAPHSSRPRPAHGSSLPVVPDDPDESSGEDVFVLTSPVTSLPVVSSVVALLVLALVDDIEAAEVGAVAAVAAVVPVDASVSLSVPALPSSPAGHPSATRAATNNPRAFQISMRIPASCPHLERPSQKSTRSDTPTCRPAILGTIVLLCAFLLAAASVSAPTDDAPAASKKELWLQSKASVTEPGRAAAREAVEVLYARNLHTHEVMALEGPDVTPQAVDAFLRCWFTEEQRDIPDELVARMRSAAHRFDARQVHIVSGFRHVKYNKLLRKKGHEVALQSEHTTGSAIDFSLPGVDVTTLYKWLLAEHDGGVGFYRGSGFVHIDTGRKRTWKGT